MTTITLSHSINGVNQFTLDLLGTEHLFIQGRSFKSNPFILLNGNNILAPYEKSFNHFMITLTQPAPSLPKPNVCFLRPKTNDDLLYLPTFEIIQISNRFYLKYLCLRDLRSLFVLEDFTLQSYEKDAGVPTNPITVSTLPTT